ncbi:MAG: hypothetical protein FWE70_06975, partial [Oscillospiraceae bacterium]|nr:hypothetical protein [Oscillospiraceae bacterium]
MASRIAFDVPLSGFAGATFLNCFTSVYLFLEGIPHGRHERHFFTFGTLCGHTSLRFRYGGEPTAMERLLCVRDFYDCGGDAAVDYLFGLAGYDFGQMVDPADFKGEIESMVDAGRPVIVGTKAANDQYRIITGYDGEMLLSPEYKGAQRPPENPPTYDEIEVLYVFGGKAEPRYGLPDGLRQIVKVMEANKAEDTWGTYLAKFGSYPEGPDSFIKAGAEEKAARMRRLQKSMWDVMNVHNFAEVFRHRHHDGLRDPALDELRARL